VFLKNLSETILFGKNFAKKLKPYSILLLKGPIGAGKTSLVQGIAEGLSITESITSPTFALSHHYFSGKIPLIHMDFYRVENSLSAEELFLEEEEELSENGGVMIIEWPELILPIINSYWLIEICYGKEFGRYYKIIDNQK
tara:strand:- start:4026 stop:4448 length:423 start_codon:yes stop_codon:yes gene_type:complete